MAASARNKVPPPPGYFFARATDSRQQDGLAPPAHHPSVNEDAVGGILADIQCCLGLQYTKHLLKASGPGVERVASIE